MKLPNALPRPAGELEALSNNLANFLISSGAATGSMVVLFMEDTVEVIAATIASPGPGHQLR